MPAKPLLSAAPWIVERGNHELCSRTGPGWFYFLNPTQTSQSITCGKPHNGKKGLKNRRFRTPYAIQTGTGQDAMRFILLDSTNACDVRHRTGEKTMAMADDTQADKLINKIVDIAKDDMPNWIVTHRPVWGMRQPKVLEEWENINQTMQIAIAKKSDTFNPNIQLILAGHTHMFSNTTFVPPSNPLKKHPDMIAIGNSGVCLNGTDQIAVMIFTVVALTRRPDSRIQVAIIKS